MRTINAILVMSCSVLTLGFAQAENLIQSGGVKVSGKTFDIVNVSGNAKLTDIIANTIKVSGGAKLSNVQANSVEVSGGLTFSNLEVNGDVGVSGSIRKGINLKCKKLTASGSVNVQNIESETMELKGSVNLEKVQVTNDAKMSGNINIKVGKFDNLNFVSNTMNLKDVTVNNIIVEERGKSVVMINNVIFDAQEEQVLHLKGTTTVLGDIRFISGKGRVIVEDDAKVVGEIIGLIEEKDGVTFNHLEDGSDGDPTTTVSINSQEIECNELSESVSFVSHDARISGSVDIKMGEFDNLNLVSNTMNLEDVTVNNIFVEEGEESFEMIDDAQEEQVLSLKGSTTVLGNITFKSGEGTVIIEDDAKVIGKITGLKKEKSELPFNHLEIDGEIDVSDFIRNCSNSKCNTQKASVSIKDQNIDCATMELSEAEDIENVQESDDLEDQEV